jgi:DNA-binding PucR family transcriptional regulator
MTRASSSPVSDPDSLQRQNRALRQLVDSLNHLTALALEAGDVAAITRALAGRLQRSVAVFSPGLEPLASAGPEGVDGRDLLDARSDQRLAAALDGVGQTRRAVRIPAAIRASHPAYVVAPIMVGEDVVAYLVCFEGPHLDEDDFDLLMTEHAATVYAVAMGRASIARELSAAVKDDLLEGLLLGRVRSRQEERRCAEYLGLSPSVTYRLLTLTVDGSGASLLASQESSSAEAALRRRVFQIAAHVVSTRTTDAIVSVRRDELVIVAPERSQVSGRPALTARDLGNAAIEHVGRVMSGVQLRGGMSGPIQQAEDIGVAYQQARGAISTSLRFGRAGQVAAFEELGIYRLLVQIPERNELHLFLEQTLGKLLEHDRKHNSGFVRTLSVYLRRNGSLLQASRELHVHTNTVTYRLGRIQDLTGLDLSVHDDRVAIELALMILDGLEGR